MPACKSEDAERPSLPVTVGMINVVSVQPESIVEPIVSSAHRGARLNEKYQERSEI